MVSRFYNSTALTPSLTVLLSMCTNFFDVLVWSRTKGRWERKVKLGWVWEWEFSHPWKWSYVFPLLIFFVLKMNMMTFSVVNPHLDSIFFGGKAWNLSREYICVDIFFANPTKIYSDLTMLLNFFLKLKFSIACS